MTVVIGLDQTPAYFTEMLGKMKEAAKRAAVKTAVEAAGIAQYRLIPSRTPQPVDRGNYKRSWKFRATENGALVYNDNPAATHVEYGVRGANVKPGKAMRAAISEWAKRKGFTPEPPTPPKNPSIHWEPPTAEEIWNGMIWAIVMGMKKHGIMNHGKGWGIQRELRTLIPAMLDKNLRHEYTIAMKGGGEGSTAPK